MNTANSKSGLKRSAPKDLEKMTDKGSESLETTASSAKRTHVESANDSHPVEFLSEIQANGVNRASGKLSVSLPILPEAHQSPGVAVAKGKPHFYLTKAAKSYRKRLQDMVRNSFPLFFEANKETTLIPSKTIVFVDKLVFVFPRPAKELSTPKAPELDKGIEGKATNEFFFLPKKPDLDNLLKTFFDALEGLVFESDATIVAYESISKVEGPEPEIYIELRWSREIDAPSAYKGPEARYSTK